MQRINMAIMIAGAIILVTAFSFFATSLGGQPYVEPSLNPAPDNMTKSNVTIMLNGVPDVRQSTDITGGAAALQAVLSYWGVDQGEYDIMTLLNGSVPDNIVNASKRFGLLSYLKTNLTEPELNDSIDRRVPVIVTLNDSGLYERYMVVIGIDGENVYLEDPTILGSRAIIPYDDFSGRWRWSGQDNVTYYHPGIFIIGESPAQYSKYVTVV